MIKLVPFSEANKKHITAFNYFAYDAGHVEYLVNGKANDYDFDFRELIAKKFGLCSDFTEDPNGCCHTLVSRFGDMANFDVSYGYGEDCDELVFNFDGKLFYDVKKEAIIMALVVETIRQVNNDE